MPSQQVQLIARVPASLRKRVRIHAAGRGVSMSKLIAELLDRTVRKEQVRAGR